MKMETVLSPFEIRVALIGYVSVGKTTILNALLKDKYSEVSMKRTTAAINIFRVSERPHHAVKQEASNGVWSADEPRSPESTLQEITSDNKILRYSTVLQEKTFNIELDEPLFEMRNDTRLTLIDVPGINEAGVSKKYKDYVLRSWHSFDCAILVLDGRQGVNTDEQVELLKMARQQCLEAKQIPVIILMNKIDEPHDEEQQVLVKEATEAIERIFGVPSRAKALDDIMMGKSGCPRTNKSFSPLVIGISAIHAFIYRMASTLTFDSFKTKVDKALVDKLGHEGYGLKWKRFSAAEKMKKAYEVIQDKDQYQDGLEASQFHKFLAALSFCVGGSSTQDWLIEEQINVSTKRLGPDLDFVVELKSLYKNCVKLNKPVDFIPARYLEIHKLSTDKSFQSFTGPDEVHHLAKPMEELFSYWQLVKHMGIAEEKKQEIIDLAKQLVLQQVGIVLNTEQWKSKDLTCYDWVLITGSMLGVCHGRIFSEHLVLARILLEKNFHEAMERCLTRDITTCCQCKSQLEKLEPVTMGKNPSLVCHPCRVCYVEKDVLDQRRCVRQCKDRYGGHMCVLDSADRCYSSCCYFHKLKPKLDPLQFRFAGGTLVPLDSELYKEYVHFTITESPADPKHCGHLLLRFGDLLQSIHQRPTKKRKERT